MARRRVATLDKRPARAMTAAATRLDPRDRDKARKEARKRPLDWQKAAFGHYDDVGEAKFAANWMGNALSRIRLVPGYMREVGADPVVVDTADAAKDAKVDDVERIAAVTTLARIGANEGGEGEIMRGAGVNLFVAGEFYLVGYRLPGDPDETWGVYSVDAMTVDSDGKYAIKPAPNARRPDYISLPDDGFVLRVTRRHPRWPDMPDSALFGAREYCEDLWVLQMMIRAAATSRVPAKILGVPQEASFASDDNEDGDDEDELTKDLIEHMTEPLADPRSAASLVPFILRLAKADLDGVKVFDLTREIDRVAIDLREETRRAFAASVDLPEGIVLGTQDLNHWTRASITEEAYTIHVEPYARGIADAFTFGYFRPGLTGLVEEPGKWLIMLDPSGLVSSPDQFKDAVELYDRVEISGDHLRQVAGVPDEAVPDDVEIARRERLASIRGAARGSVGGGNGAEPVADTGEAEPRTGPEAVAASLVPAAIVAASPVERLGVRLARREMALRERLRLVADEALHRALERAGSRLRSLAQRDRSGLARRSVEGVPAHLVASTMGESMVAAVGADVDDLLQGAWDRVGGRWDALVSAAQRAAIDDARALGASAGLTAAGIGEWQQRGRQQRDEGRAVLLAALAALAAARLFNPTVPVPERGEFDETTLVPPRLIRRALAIAGGGLAAVDESIAMRQGEGGLLSGQWITDLFAEVARVQFGAGYVWLYGDPSSRTVEFEGHSFLDDTEFARWDDDALAVLAGDEWIGTHYYPDDHQGCQCEVARIAHFSGEDEG